MIQSIYLYSSRNNYGLWFYPLASSGGTSGLFLAFLGTAGAGEGDVENDLDLNQNKKKFNVAHKDVIFFLVILKIHNSVFYIQCSK